MKTETKLCVDCRHCEKRSSPRKMDLKYSVVSELESESDYFCAYPYGAQGNNRVLCWVHRHGRDCGPEGKLWEKK